KKVIGSTGVARRIAIVSTFVLAFTVLFVATRGAFADEEPPPAAQPAPSEPVVTPPVTLPPAEQPPPQPAPPPAEAPAKPPPQLAQATEAGKPSTKLKPTVVTGSLIPTFETITPTPVDVYSVEQIEKTGASTTREFLRQIPSS